MFEVGTKTVHELLPHEIITLPGSEEDWNLDSFRDSLEVKIHKISNSSDELEFDIVNVDCSFANALRRILIAEVPSVAIDRVYLYQNTSVMPDEVFCHRLGLLPLSVDPDLLDFPSDSLPPTDEVTGLNPGEHLLFKLHVQFTRTEAKSRGKKTTDSTHEDGNDAVVKNRPIYSSSLEWVSLSGQEEKFSSQPPSVVADNILLNRIVVGDEIYANCLAVKGIGRDHAKFSPVSACGYKFHPIIKIKPGIKSPLSEQLQRSFAEGVIEVNPRTGEPFVKSARLDNGSREFHRHEASKELVSVGVNPRHCIFTIESTSSLRRPATHLVLAGFDVMLQKTSHYLVSDLLLAGKSGGKTKKGKKGKDVPAPTSAESTACEQQTKLNGRESGLSICHSSDDKQRVTFVFLGEDHTLGSALRYCILRRPDVEFCGYCVPHPLEDKINFDIQMQSGCSAIDALREGLSCLHDCFKHMKTTFESALTSFQASVSAEEPMQS